MASPISELIYGALDLITAEITVSRRPLVAWSGGKDSQVLLALTRIVRKGLPVAHFRPFESPSKHLFADLIIGCQDLNLVQMLPAFRQAIAKGDHIEIVEAYQINQNAFIYFPIEAEPDHVPGPGSHCAIQKINEPTTEQALDFDCLFIGHRSDDIDPAHGAIPLKEDVIEAAGVRTVYPLKSWTEADVWEAGRILNVAQNAARYSEQRMEANADYYPLCTECLKAGAGDSIICPKINEPVYRLGNFLNLEERRLAMRKQFINLES